MTDLDTMVLRCDPGIRNVVRLLNSFGYETTDSGDGVSKLTQHAASPYDGWYYDPDALPYPHVAMVVAGCNLVSKANGLLIKLQRADIHVESLGLTGREPYIEATYNPVSGVGVLFLWNISDADLKRSRHPRFA